MLKRSYEDFLKSDDKLNFIVDCINEYIGSEFYRKAITAQTYFEGDNEAIMNLPPLRVKLPNQTFTLPFAKIPSNIFKRLILQVCNYQLSNGISINDTPIDDLLGNESNRKVLMGAINSMTHGVSFGYVNGGNLQKIYKATNMFTINDEWSDRPEIAVHFWKSTNVNGEQQYAEIFEKEGVTNIKINKDGKAEILEERKPYITKIRVDKATGETLISEENPNSLPIIPFFINDSRTSELTNNIKSKIDNLDEIVSRNATFVNRTSMIFWLINTTGVGDPDEISNMIIELEKLGISVNESDGLSAEPKVIDPNVEPRLTTKRDLEDDIYKDFMSLNMESLTQGNLTATAINVSGSMLKMKASDLYYYTSDFLRKIFNFIGVEVNSISMKEDSLSNDFEKTQMIYTARADLTHKKTLQLLPFIEDDGVEEILNDFQAEQQANMPTLKELEKEIEVVEE